MLLRFLSFVFLLVIPCKGPTPSVGGVLPPELACQFETVFESKEQNQTSFKSVWRFWRATEEVESWQVGSKEGEVAALDGAGGVHFRRVFHPERIEVFYSAMELKMLGRTRDWGQSFSLVAPEFLKERLAPTGTEVLLDTTLEKYEGTVDGRQWVVLWSAREQLAYRLRVESERGVSTTTLLERYDLEKQPWERLRKRGYNSIDFADLGDSETNPVIRRIMNRLGISCSHKSCGGVCTPRR
jgi:hypothetical protein